MAEGKVEVTWYDDPAKAEADLEAEYRAMTPTERVAECIRLMILCAGWQEHGRLARTARIVSPQ